MRLYLTLGSILTLLAVAAGAFGAHGLKRILSPDLLTVYHTAVDYHMWHALGLLIIGVLLAHQPDSVLLRWAGGLMLTGILVFSGSLYALSLTGLRGLGAITPLGGIAFMAAWALVALQAWRGI